MSDAFAVIDMTNVAARGWQPFQSSRRVRRAIHGVPLLAAIFAYAAPPTGAAPVSIAGATDKQTDHFEGTIDHVRIAAIERASGGADKASVVVVIDPGYHINANPASSDYLIPTTLNLTEPAPLRVLYPDPVRFKPKFVDEPIAVYEGTIRVTAIFSRDALRRFPWLRGSVTAQACTDEYCLPPAEIPFQAR